LEDQDLRCPWVFADPTYCSLSRHSEAGRKLNKNQVNKSTAHQLRRQMRRRKEMPKEQTRLEQWILDPSRYLFLSPSFNCYLRPQAGRQTCGYPHLIPSHDSSWWSLRRSKHFPLSTRHSIVAISVYLVLACFPCPSHLFVAHPATDSFFSDRISLDLDFT
jgi:hypothetical protein